MRFAPKFSAFVTAAAILAGSAVQAGPVSFASGWNEQRLQLFNANSYSFGSQLGIASDGAVSLAWTRLPRNEWGASGASWSWRVDQSVAATDLGRKGGDDRNISIYFVFLPEAEATRLEGANIRQLMGLDDDRLKKRVREVWGAIRESSADRKQQVAAYKEKLTAETLAKANLGNGRRLFAKTCAACHRLFGTGGKVGGGFLIGFGLEKRRVGRFKIKWQTHGQNMPKLAIILRAGMQLCPDDGGEIRIAKRAGIGHWIVEKANKMIRQRDEIIALSLIPAANFGRFQHAIGQGRMGVQIATVKLAGLREKVGHFSGSRHLRTWFCPAACQVVSAATSGKVC